MTNRREFEIEGLFVTCRWLAAGEWHVTLDGPDGLRHAVLHGEEDDSVDLLREIVGNWVQREFPGLTEPSVRTDDPI